MNPLNPQQQNPHTPYHAERMAQADRLYQADGLMPYRYVFVLTNRCNLACPFCFQEKKNLAQTLSAGDWVRVVDQLPAYAWVTLTGGEPLLFPGFLKVFQTVTRAHGCNIITNGLLLDRPLTETLLSRPNFRILSISLDGPGNALRGVAPSAWREVEENLEFFRRKRDELQSSALLDIKTLVLDENTENLYETHRYCMETLKCDTHSFQLLKGSPLQHADKMFPEEEMYKEPGTPGYRDFPALLAQLERVREYNLRTGRRSFVHPLIVDLNSENPIEGSKPPSFNEVGHRREAYGFCRTPWESVHINADGNLFPCLAIGMGNVKTDSLADIVQGPRFQSFKRVLRMEGTVPACHRCGYLLPKSGFQGWDPDQRSGGAP